MPPHAEYVRIRFGLLESKHVAKLGGGPWPLYLYLQGIVRLKGEGAGTTFPDHPYTHHEAAEYMAQPTASVRRWFGVLVNEGYVTTKQHRRGLIVTITNFDPGQGSRVPTSEHPEMVTPPNVGAQISSFGRPDLDVWVPTSEHPQEPPIKEAHARQENKRTRDSSPPPSPPMPEWQADVVEAFAARGLPAPDLSGNEGLHARKLLKENTPDLLARCWQDIAAGEYGDDWLQRNLSFVTLTERGRFNNWLMAAAGKSTPPKRANGESRFGMAAARRVIERNQDRREQRALTGS